MIDIMNEVFSVKKNIINIPVGSGSRLLKQKHFISILQSTTYVEKDYKNTFISSFDPNITRIFRKNPDSVLETINEGVDLINCVLIP